MADKVTLKTGVKPPSYPSRVVKKREDVLITWNEKSKFHAPGTTSTVHAAMADKYIALGIAVKGKVAKETEA